MKPFYACNSLEHAVSRRHFLTGSAAGLGALGFADMIRASGEIERRNKRVLVIYLAGGVSQLETWDPKPGTNTGGPFQAIPTNVTGVHICELLPHTARHMHRLALIRGINTNMDDHGGGAYIMMTGRRRNPGESYPHLGAVMSKLLGDENNPLPGYIHITPGSGNGGFNRGDAAFLGPRYASVTLPDGNPPANLSRPNTLSELADAQRNDLRERLNNRFMQTRRSADTEAYTTSYDQAAQVMQRRSIFDLSREPAHLRERYGNHDFGRHCLLARRLLENGVTFAKVSHSNYDTHHENFDFHIEQLGEFDRTFATLLDDLAQRGMLESTLVVVMSEFGRTPTINRNLGRDHWSRAWSIAAAGSGIQGGAVVGRTNDNGTAVVDRQVNGGHLFHTYFRALGLNPTRNHYAGGRPIPMADPQASAISEILS
ncbi:MAG: DUF1501 domain-containing protein [Gemmataceae bacterium]|nr:DUF1501 domain-containing protein [Gemmataceae bacterium]MCI0742416.1 DUF1501 domain-containing protein [Gemmataceae bacterium]